MIGLNSNFRNILHFKVVQDFFVKTFLKLFFCCFVCLQIMLFSEFFSSRITQLTFCLKHKHVTIRKKSETRHNFWGLCFLILFDLYLFKRTNIRQNNLELKYFTILEFVTEIFLRICLDYFFGDIFITGLTHALASIQRPGQSKQQ